MKESIIFSVALLLIITFFIYDFKEGFNSKRNMGEGKLSYYKRMFVKHVERPVKLKAKDIRKKTTEEFTKFKRSYL